MSAVGIEAMNVFGGSAYIDVRELADHRKLDQRRVANLLMTKKTVPLPYEDPVTYAVNAAKPVIDALSADDRERIELVVTCTESGVDFGKSLSAYIHRYLELPRTCRLFEVKQACYSGTAGVQTAADFVSTHASPGAKALVVTTDISRFLFEDAAAGSTADLSFTEPNSGAGAVAMVIGDRPELFVLDRGANGYYSYEVMDTCRPSADSEVCDANLSLLSYLDCLEQAFRQYQRRVDGADFQSTFHYLTFHTPFGGMVKGAHRIMMRKLSQANADEIDADFQRRMAPGLAYCQQVGNIMGGTLFMALASAIDNAGFETAKRIGCFSYGSGCCSEFFSGVVPPTAQATQAVRRIQQHLDGRYRLSMSEYESLLRKDGAVTFGARHARTDLRALPGACSAWEERPHLLLTGITDYRREYTWSHELARA